MGRKRGNQKGPQQHAEGQHGAKTHRRLVEQLHEGEPAEPREAAAARDRTHRQDGGHRLFEGREQHEEAESNSEKTRLSRDIERHGHERENFQVRGGADSARALPSSHIDPSRPDAPNPEREAAPPVDVVRKRRR